jgi:hypothetical protein
MAGGGACLIAVGAVAMRWPGLVPRLAVRQRDRCCWQRFRALSGRGCPPYAAVDPLVATLWLNRVSETMSIHMLYRLEPERIVGLYAPLLITLILAGAVAWRAAPDVRIRWLLGINVLAAIRDRSLADARAAAATMRRRLSSQALSRCGRTPRRGDCCSLWCCSHRWCWLRAGRCCGRCSRQDQPADADHRQGGRRFDLSRDVRPPRRYRKFRAAHARADRPWSRHSGRERAFGSPHPITATMTATSP